MPPTNLTVNDLQSGDLILWRMGDGDATHAELFTGASHFAATSIHAVNTPAKQMTRVMANSFTPQFYKHVFRCQRQTQRDKAVKFAQQWARYENRYDTQRIAIKTAFRAMHRNLGTPRASVLAQMRHLFATKGRFRAMKYATRRASILCYPGDDGESGHGMTCCMFAILCFQVAGLAPHVDKLNANDPHTRVSDKKMSPADLAVLKKMMAVQKFPNSAYEEYRLYVQGLQDQNEYQIDWGVAQKAAVVKGPAAAKKVGYNYYPSVMMWRNPVQWATFDWGDAVTTGMMLDAKIATPQDLWDSVESDPGNWEYRGSMANAGGAAPTDAQKLAYQGQLQANQAAATARRHNMI